MYEGETAPEVAESYERQFTEVDPAASTDVAPVGEADPLQQPVH